MSSVVILFTSDPCGEYEELSRCPMEAYGPFATSKDAHTFMETLPESFLPHSLLLTDPTSDGRRA